MWKLNVSLQLCLFYRVMYFICIYMYLEMYLVMLDLIKLNRWNRINKVGFIEYTCRMLYMIRDFSPEEFRKCEHQSTNNW